MIREITTKTFPKALFIQFVGAKNFSNSNVIFLNGYVLKKV